MAKEKDMAEESALARQVAELQQQVQALLQMQQGNSVMAGLQQQLAEMQVHNAQEEKKARETEAQLKEVSAFISLPYQQRSQYEANKTFLSGTKVYQVVLGTGKNGEWPELFIRADMESDAKARYQMLCGITSVRADEQHPERTRFRCIDVTSMPEAKKKIEQKFEYQAA